MSGETFLIVWSNAPNPELAAEIARALVSEGVAACVHVLPGGASFYVWEGELNQDAESTLMIKTTATAYPALEARLKSLHPYEVPEILATPVVQGYPPYLRWLADSCSGAGADSR